MKEALQYLIAVIRWRFSPKKWIGYSVYINGRCRNVIGETFGTIIINGIKRPVQKSRCGGVGRPWVIEPNTKKNDHSR
jgi:hypothetical protein